MRSQLLVFVLVTSLVCASLGLSACARQRSAASLRDALASVPCVVQTDLPAIEMVVPGASHLGGLGNQAAGPGFAGSLAGAGTGSPTPAPSPSLSGPCVDPKIGELMLTLRSAAAALPADEIDVGARAQTLPSDVATIFAFVRDQIRLDAYYGAMRGPLGTLESRAGNPTDKTLLLAELLHDKGMQVRWVRGTLSPDEIAQLTDLAQQPTPAFSPEPLAQPVPSPSNFDADAVNKAVAKLREVQQKQLNDDIAAANDNAKTLASLLSQHGVNVGPATSGGPMDYSAMFRTHYWIQVQQGAAWLDLDPSSPKLNVGQHLGSVDQAFSDTTLPEEEFVSLTISLNEDTQKNGQPVTTNLITQTKHAADFVNQGVELFVSTADPQASPEAATSFNCQVTIGGNPVASAPIDLSDPQVKLQKLRLQIDVTAPDQAKSKRSYQRTLFDIQQIGQAPHALGYQLIGDYQFLVVPAELNSAFAARTIMMEIVNQQTGFAWADAAARGTTGKTLPRINPEKFPIELLRYVRDEYMFAQNLGSAQSQPVRFYYDRPDIIMLHRGYRIAADGGMSAIVGFDIFDNGMAAVSSDTTTAAHANIARGYLDTVLEQQTIAGAAVGTPQIIDAAAKAGVQLTVERPETAQAGASLSLPPTAAANLQATLDAGQAAVIPNRPVTINGKDMVGWWAVDPQSGNTVGRISSGGGQAEVEYVEVLNTFYSEMDVLKFYYRMFECIGIGIAQPLSGHELPDVRLDFVKCMAAAFCDLGTSLLADHLLESNEDPVGRLVINVAGFPFGAGDLGLCKTVEGL